MIYYYPLHKGNNGKWKLIEDRERVSGSGFFYSLEKLPVTLIAIAQVRAN